VTHGTLIFNRMNAKTDSAKTAARCSDGSAITETFGTGQREVAEEVRDAEAA
jgi:hypothetical protein